MMFVDINKASELALTTLNGIGPAKAAAIVRHRTQNKFRKTADLTLVNGVSTQLYENLKHRLIVKPIPDGTKFFKNLCQETQHGNGMSYKEDGSWVFVMVSGKYSGKWKLGHRTVYSRLSLPDCLWTQKGLLNEHVASMFDYASWKKAMASTSTFRQARRDLYNLRELLLRAFNESGTAAGVEFTIWGLLGQAGVTQFRSLNSFEQKAVKNWINSIFFCEVGASRRVIVLRRMLTMKMKAAWKKSYRLHPAIVNQLVQKCHSDGLGLFEAKYLRGLGAQARLEHVLWLRQELGWCIRNSVATSDILKCVIDWYARYPGQFTLLQGLVRELTRFERNGWSDMLMRGGDEDHLSFMADTLMRLEDLVPDQVRRIHDKDIPEAIARAQEMARASLIEQERLAQAFKERRDLLYKERLAKYGCVKDAWYKLKSTCLKKQWNATLAFVEVPGLRLLRTMKEFHHEGISMKHCVAGYFQDCNWDNQSGDEIGQLTSWSDPLHYSDPSEKLVEFSKKILSGEIVPKVRFMHVYHVEHAGERGTLAVSTLADGSEVIFNQFQGPCNSRPSQELVEYVKSCFIENGWDSSIVRAGY